MDIQVGGEMNELMSTKMCSPMMIYVGIVVTCAISVYITRDNLKRHNTNKMDNLFNIYSLNELKFIIVFGIILFGLCQYNKTTLAWVFLILPVVYLLIQNLIIYIHVSSAVQSAPKEVVGPVQYTPQIVPQDTQTSQPPPMVPSMKQSVDMPVVSRSSQVLGGSSDFGGVGSSGPSNYAYF